MIYFTVVLPFHLNSHICSKPGFLKTGTNHCRWYFFIFLSLTLSKGKNVSVDD